MKKLLKSCLLIIFLILAIHSNAFADSTVPAAYKSTFNSYKNDLYYGNYNEKTYGAINLADNPFSLDGSDAINFVGYNCEDINGDGIKEFMVGLAETRASFVVALYTLENETPKLVVKSSASPYAPAALVNNLPNNPDISNTITIYDQFKTINSNNYLVTDFYKLNGTNLEFSTSYTSELYGKEFYKSTDPNNPLQTKIDAIPEEATTGRREISMTPFANYVDIPEQGPTGSIYRVCNIATNEHLYTQWFNEAEELCKSGAWRNEGIAWTAPQESATPIYRLYNADINDHLYTSDPHEVQVLTTEQNWAPDNNGNPVFYSGGSVPIYRLYNPTNYRHLLTRDENEYKTLPDFGWEQESVALYATS